MTRMLLLRAQALVALAALSTGPTAGRALAAGPDEPTSGSDGRIRRFALTVSANDGGAARDLLRYADSDAADFAAVMQELGGVAAQETRSLRQPTAAQVTQAVTELAARMRAAAAQGQRVQFLFYYSGHSDETGLRLKGELLSYAQLRALITKLPAEVKIGVLDSCASGAFTRLKGGHRQAPFLIDRSNEVRGHAYLASSAESEAAQESDRIAGSFFTHYLISGLRGAADFSGDGKVTLSEAYRFAFDETLARTQSTRAGPQHPAYDIKLAGTGDVVMTDLRKTTALLVVDKAIEGRLYIRDASGQLAAELRKPRGRIVELGLAAGTYTVTVDVPQHSAQAEIELRALTRTALAAGDLRRVPHDQAVASRKGEQAPEDYRLIPLAVSLFPPLDSNLVEEERKVINNFGFVIGYGEVAAIEGMQLGLGVPHVDERVAGGQITVAANLVEGTLDGFQLSTGANVAGREARGVQISAGVNVAGATLWGAQIVAGLNLARRVEGAQIAGGFNATENLAGAQLAPVNLAAGVAGPQLGVVNIATERIDGPQLGVVNVAAAIEGAQLGVVNVSGPARGLQLGVVNYAEDADVQLGVINFSRKHGIAGQVFSSDLAIVNAAIRFNAGITYSLLWVATHPFNDDQHMLGLGLGLSGRLASRLWLEGDLTSAGYGYQSDWDEGSSQAGQVRLMLRYGFGVLSVFAGPALTVAVHTGDHVDREPPGYNYTAYRSPGSPATEILLRPGFTAGIQLF